MDFRMTMAWDEQCGILLSKMYPLRELFGDVFEEKSYGKSVEHIWTIIVCLDRDYKQRKLFRKADKRLSFEILLDFNLIRHSSNSERNEIINARVLNVVEQTISKYKFDDFDKVAFLSDFKSHVDGVKWLK